MPYTLDEDRERQKAAIAILTDAIQSKGDLNYTICELVGQLILKTKISYTQISEWIDGVHGAERELTRRILGPYEDLKIQQNGDVESFVEILEKME